MMSAKDPVFLGMLESWLRCRPEILVLIRHSRAAGAKDFELLFSYESLFARLDRLPAGTSVIAFRERQLPMRGVVDEKFISACLSALPENAEFLAMESSHRQDGRTPASNRIAGETHAELRDALEEWTGRPAAVGLYPPWLAETADVIAAVVPDVSGVVQAGVY